VRADGIGGGLCEDVEWGTEGDGEEWDGGVLGEGQADL